MNPTKWGYAGFVFLACGLLGFVLIKIGLLAAVVLHSDVFGIAMLRELVARHLPRAA